MHLRWYTSDWIGQMKLIILCGPTGTGKNTIAELVAHQRRRCAIVDFDVLRNMFRKPHLTPWDGEAGNRQNLLGIEHASMLASSLIGNGYDCIILDVLSDETARAYREQLSQFDPVIIHLLPTYDEIIRRNRTRPPRLTEQELETIYKKQCDFSGFDFQIDNTQLPPEVVAQRIHGLMG